MLTGASARGKGRRLGSSRAARWRLVYLPREVFFGRLGFAGAFFSVWTGAFGRFFPATSGSFPTCPCREAHPNELGLTRASASFLQYRLTTVATSADAARSGRRD